MAFQITYSTLNQYFHNVAQGKTKGSVTPTQIASALSGMLQRAADAAGPNPLQMTLADRLAALRTPSYGTGQGYGQDYTPYGNSGSWGRSWMSPYGRGGFNRFA